jgi:hypothetical protein
VHIAFHALRDDFAVGVMARGKFEDAEISKG